MSGRRDGTSAIADLRLGGGRPHTALGTLQELIGLEPASMLCSGVEAWERFFTEGSHCRHDAAKVWKSPGRYSTKHCCSKEHWLRGPYRCGRNSGGVCEELANQRGLTCASTDNDGIDAYAGRIQCFDDLPESISEPTHSGDVEGHETVDRSIEGQARDHGSCVWIRKRRSVAVE
jgi:hypothetical protein